MSASNLMEAAMLKLLFNNADTFTQTPSVVIGAAGGGLRGSTTAGNFFVCLLQGDPLETLASLTEANYTGYARQPLARSTAGWTVSGTAPTQVVNAAEALFPLYGGGTVYDVSHWGVCSTATVGAADILFIGALTPSGAELTVGSGVQPRFAPGALVLTFD